MIKKIPQSLSSLWQMLLREKNPKTVRQHPEPWMLLLAPNAKLTGWFPSQKEQQRLTAQRIKKWRIAVTFLFLGGLSAMGGILLSGKSTYVHVKTQNYQKKIVLADGSNVRLNTHSSLRYNTDFGDTKRQLKLLKGEAYFDVASTAIPFTVDLPDKSQIQVMGTAFNVIIDKDNQRIATFLEEGRVHWNKENNTQKLQPGDRVSTAISPKSTPAKWEKQQLNSNEIDRILHWKNKPFKFNNTPLASIVEELEAYYQIEIKITPSIKKDAFTGSFSREMQLPEILDIITTTSNYRLQEKSNGWSIE